MKPFVILEKAIGAAGRLPLCWCLIGLALGSAAVSAGCSGAVGGGAESLNGPGGSGNGPGVGKPGEGEAGGAASLCMAPAPGVMPLRRLTRLQFNNTVKDLFGSAIANNSDFPDTALRDGFRTYADINTVTADGAGSIATAAVAVAKNATGNLNQMLGCTPSLATDDACVGAYLDVLAKEAYRRPPEQEELQILKQTYGTLRAAGWSVQDSVAGVVEVILQSPQFLYLSDVGKDPQAVAGSVQSLTDYEIAARLSYFLWDSKPDKQLTDLADEGKLHDPAALENEARRLLESPRAQPLLAQFVEDWLHLQRLEAQNKDAAQFPEWNVDLKNAMRAEVAAFINEVAFRGDGKLSTLLSASYTVANGPLAKLYGASAGGDAKNFERLDLNPQERSGLLTSAAFLTAHAGSNEPFPVLRGAFVRTQMLCQELVPPPNLVFELPPADPNVRGRERFAQHRDDPACSGCHALMDPIGFGLENYDAMGRYRTKEGNDLDIDASGELIDAGDDISGPFVGAIELSQRLSKSSLVRDCVAQQLFSYAIARKATEADDCAVRGIADRFAKSDGDLKELVVAIAMSDAFMFHRIAERAE